MHLLYSIFLAVPLAVLGVTTDDVLAKLDQNAASFSGMTANLTRLTYTKVIDDKTTEQGTIALKKQGPKDFQVLIDFSKPDPRTVSFRGRKAEIYYPKIKTVQEIDLGKRTDLMDQFMLVGFGTSGKDLKANYSIKLAGEESVAGQKAHRLQLTPLKTAAASKLQPLELWISDAGGYPVQQKFVQPSGDYHLFTYQDVKLNPPLADEALRMKLPKGVKREFPQR